MGEVVIDWDSEEPVALGGEFSGVFPAEVEGCVLFQTSGSSGVKKWVALPREALWWSAEQVVAHLGMTDADVCGLTIPEWHVGGFGLRTRANVCGAKLERWGRRWDAVVFGEWCAAKGVTVSSLVPTQVNDLIAAKVKAPSAIRTVVVGGGALSRELEKGAAQLGWPVVPSYGMTETSAQVATGKGLPLIDGWEAKTMEDGRLALRGGGLLRGYVIDGEFFDPKEEGWFVTGDLASVVDGKIRWQGRADRKVKVLGELIDLEVLEEFWKEQLGFEVVVIARPVERRVHELVLIIEGPSGKKDASIEKKVDRLNLELPGVERAAEVRWVDQMPRSGLGKIDRGVLRCWVFDEASKVRR